MQVPLVAPPTRPSCPAKPLQHIGVLYLLVLATAWLQHPAVASAHAGRRLCEESGYCSLSLQPSRYVGPINTNKELKTALQALVFKKEIIITQDNRVNDAAQFIANFHRAGYGHVLVVAPEKLCGRLVTTFDHLGCGWYNLTHDLMPDDPRITVLRGFGGWTYLKHWTGARIARMGYNVLILDADVMVINDFYAYVKAPPLNDMHVIIQADGGTSVNCGFMYLQNCNPAGPAVWALAEPSIRTLRWRNNPSGLVALGVPADFYCWEQQCIEDTYYSAVLGRPFFHKCIHSNNISQPLWYTLLKNATGTEGGVPSTSFVTSAAMRRVVADPSYDLRNVTIRLPHIYGARNKALGIAGWPDDLGGHIYGSGPMNDTVKEVIHDFLVEETDAPLWPDLEDPATADAADAVPAENLLFAPQWISNLYTTSGAYGQWNKDLSNHSRTIIAHIGPGLPPGVLQKPTIAMCTGHYNFSVSERLWGGPLRGYVATHTDQVLHPHVLTYAPGVFDHNTSHDQWGEAVFDLGKHALVMQLAIGWPGAPLAAGWTHTSGNNTNGYGIGGKPHVVPWDYVDQKVVTAYPSWNETLAELSGVWTPLYDHGCFSGPRHALMPPEVKHFVSTLPPDVARPGPHNTLQIPVGAPRSPSGALEVSRDHVVSEAQRMANQPIVWLPTRVRISGALPEDEQAKVKGFHDACCAMQYDDFKANKLRRDPPNNAWPICATSF